MRRRRDGDETEKSRGAKAIGFARLGATHDEKCERGTLPGTEEPGRRFDWISGLIGGRCAGVEIASHEREDGGGPVPLSDVGAAPAASSLSKFVVRGGTNFVGDQSPHGLFMGGHFGVRNGKRAGYLSGQPARFAQGPLSGAESQR